MNRIEMARRNEAILAAVNSGKSPEQVAAEFGLSMARIYKLRRAFVNGAGQVVANLVAGEPVMFGADPDAKVTTCGHSADLLMRLSRLALGKPEREEPQPAVAPVRCGRCVRRGHLDGQKVEHTKQVRRGGMDYIAACQKCECYEWETGQRANVRGNNPTYADVTVDGKRYKHLGHGASRTVYDLMCGQHVLKVAYTWEAQSAKEVDFFINAGANLRRILAAVFAYSQDKAIIVAEKCGQPNWIAKRRALVLNAERLGIGDLHDANIGWRGNEPVIVDYGL